MVSKLRPGCDRHADRLVAVCVDYYVIVHMLRRLCMVVGTLYVACLSCCEVGAFEERTGIRCTYLLCCTCI